jgi:peptidoglycan-associated lipoprotein
LNPNHLPNEKKEDDVRRTIIATLTAASAALLFSACTTTSEEPRTGADAQQPSATTPGAQPRHPMASVDPTGKKDSTSMLKDPNNMLSKRSIYYDYGKYEIKDEYRSIIEVHAKYLRENPGLKILIEGNADERGSREYNIALGQRRSDSLRKTLLVLGAKENQIESVSLGEEKPLCRDHAEDCWWKNRRGDIRY